MVRVVLSIEGRLCSFFVRSTKMWLNDSNERVRYGRSVLDEEVERCSVPSREGEVDCLAECGSSIRGVEFKSYMDRSGGRSGADLGGMWHELSKKRVLGNSCGSGCVLVVAVFEEDSPYVLEEAEGVVAPRRVGIAYSIDELAQKVCSNEVVLLVIRQVGDCCR